MKPDATPAEPDPFAPAPADKPAADDLFAPAEPKPEMKPEPAPAPAADDLFAPAKPADKPAAVEEMPAPELAAEPAAPLGPRDVKPVSPAAVTNAMQSTFMAGQQLVAAEAAGDPAQLRKARASFYVTLFGMADALTLAQLGESQAAIGPQIQALEPAIRQQLAADPKRLDDLRVFGAKWLGFPKRTTNGIALAGTVESAEQVGELFQTKARVGGADSAQTVTIVSARPPQVAAGDQIVSLGSIVDNPQQQLAGYEGDDPTVVWSGMTMKVAPAN